MTGHVVQSLMHSKPADGVPISSSDVTLASMIIPMIPTFKSKTSHLLPWDSLLLPKPISIFVA